MEKHTVNMSERQHAVITGVKDVISFHENEIVLCVEDSEMLIGGEGLHVGRLLLEEGRLDVKGRIDSMTYEQPRSVRRLLSGLKKG